MNEPIFRTNPPKIFKKFFQFKFIKKIQTISETCNIFAEKTTAFGGVPEGNINEKDDAKVTFNKKHLNKIKFL